MPREPGAAAVEDRDRDLPGLEARPERPGRDPIELLEDREHARRGRRRDRQRNEQRDELRQEDRTQSHDPGDARPPFAVTMRQ